MRLSDFKKNNIWVTVGVVLAVIALLLLPDLLKNRGKAYVNRLHVSGSDRKTAEVPAPNSEVEASGPAARAGTQTSQVDVALEDANQTYEKFVSNVKGTGPRTNRKLQEFAARYGATKDTDLEFINIPASEQNWKRLRTRQVRGAVSKAQAATKKIAKNLQNTHPAVAEGLQAFVILLDGFYDAESQGLDALGVVQAIEDQEYQLTQQILNAGVPRLAFIDWARVSLSKLYGNTLMLEYKIDAIPPFRPNFMITRVRISINRRDIQGDATKLKSYRLELKGVLRGSDFKNLRLIHQGEFSRNQALQKDIEDPEKFHLRVKNIDAAGVYRFIFTDRFGATHERAYSFDPRRRAIKWTSQDKNLLIADLPSQEGAGVRFLGEREDFSGRLDSYYRFDRGTGDGFTVPQDNGFSSGGNTF